MVAQHYVQNHTRTAKHFVVPSDPPVEITLGPLAAGGGEDRKDLSTSAAMALQQALHVRAIPGVEPGDLSVRVRMVAVASPPVEGDDTGGQTGDQLGDENDGDDKGEG